MSFERKAIVGVIWQSVMNYAGFAITFFINIALARILFPEDYGVFALATSFAEIYLIFFSFSFGMAVIQMEDSDELFGTALILAMITGAAIMLGAIILSLIFINTLHLKITLIFLLVCFASALNATAGVYSSVSEKELKMVQNSVVRGWASVVAIIITLILALNGFGIWALVMQNLSYSIFLLLGMMKVAAIKKSIKFNLLTAKKILLFGTKGLFARGAEIAIFRIPNFFIGTFIGIKELGYFSRSLYLISLPNTMLSSVTQSVAYPFFSKISSQKEKIMKSFKIMNFLIFGILAPLSVLCALFPGEIIFIVFGSKWAGATEYLRGLTLLMLYMPMLSNIRIITYSLNKIEYTVKSYIAGILLTMFAILSEIFFIEGSFVVLYSISMVSIILFIAYYLRGIKIFVSRKEIFSMPAIFTIISLVPAYFFNTGFVWKINMFSRIAVMLFLYLILMSFFFLYRFETVRKYYKLITGKLKELDN